MNMLDMAKDLINKGNELGDSELVAMGMQMLEKYRDGEVPGLQDIVITEDVFEQGLEEIPQKYVCTNCSYTFDVDKEGRKKCPKCKKHSLVIVPTHTSLGLDTFEPKRNEMTGQIKRKDNIRGRGTAEDFSTQIRQTNKGRIRYNEEGQPDGMYSRTEQVESVTNVWDDDKTEGFDAANELLKKFTKVTPRTRKPPRMIKVVCNECKTQHDVHPIHAGGRGRYICDKCVKRRSRV